MKIGNIYFDVNEIRKMPFKDFEKLCKGVLTIIDIRVAYKQLGGGKDVKSERKKLVKKKPQSG